jgi:hypothetical protein
MFQEIVIVILDEKAGFPDAVWGQALQRGGERALAEDKALNIKRNCIRLLEIRLPDTPQGRACQKLADKIRAVAQFDISPKDLDQALWMRAVQLYWQTRALKLANLVFPVIDDPLQPGSSLTENLSPQDIENLRLETNLDKALYDLLQAGETLIKGWAKARDISWSFQDFEELFIYILNARFKRKWQQEAFSPTFSRPDKKTEKKDSRQWIKFLADHFDGEPLEEQYSSVLMDMGWEGYPLLALRHQKGSKPFKPLWKVFLKTHREAIKLIDDDLHFKNGQPHQTKQTNKKVAIQGKLTLDGLIYWTYD